MTPRCVTKNKGSIMMITFLIFIVFQYVSCSGVIASSAASQESYITDGTKLYASNSGAGYNNNVAFTTLENNDQDPRVIVLGPNSKLQLGNTITSEVEFISSVFNEGPGEMSSLSFHTLFPVDRINQKVTDIKFFPENNEIVEDDRGQNNIVHYEFKDIQPGVNTLTYWRATVKTWSLTYDIDPEDVGTLDEIPVEIADKYLIDEDLYQIYHSIIINARNEALQGETHPMKMAKNIFHWVQNHMTYNIELGWRDAPSNLETGQGSCTGWAYAFIAMCRSAGLPARWSGALVRRGEQYYSGPHKDQLYHRWAQVYLPRIGWVEANVQGGKWGYLPNRYLIISESPGRSNYMDVLYHSYRNYSFENEGSASSIRFGLWWPVFDVVEFPGEPVLSYPEDGTENVSQNQILSWDTVHSATSYRLQVSTCENFSTVNYYNGDITKTFYQPEWIDRQGTTYYWRVSASNMFGTSGWSNVWYFTVGSIP